MSHRLRAVAFVVFAAAILEVHAIAAPKPAAPPPAATPPPGGWALDTAALPPNFAGDAMADVYKQWTPAPKGEFETTEQYEKRLAKPDQSRLYFFVDETTTPTYDADAQEYVIPLRRLLERWKRRNAATQQEEFAHELQEVVSGERSYAASNAFGATITVRKKDLAVYALLFDRDVLGNGQTAGFSGMFKQSAVRLPVAIEAAPDLKGHLGLVWVCRAASRPGTATEFDFEIEKPTLQKPEESFNSRHYLRVDPVALWVFDRRNGRILLKLDAYPAAAAAAATPTPQP